jgi:hypothetical protein
MWYTNETRFDENITIIRISVKMKISKYYSELM